MPTPQPTPNFEHAALEKDIDRLAGEVSQLRESPEMQGKPEREVVKEALHRVTGHTPSTASQTTDDADDVGTSANVLPAYAQDLSPEIKLEVESLIDAAFHKGVFAAVKEARKSEPIILDIFHDAMAGKFYHTLKERGVFKD